MDEVSTWAPGVRNDWTTKAGLRAVVLMTQLGHHCGYVAVPKGHPLHGATYHGPCTALTPVGEDTPIEGRNVIAVLCAAFDESRLQSPDLVFAVHGGLTYSDADDSYPAPNDGLWWFGFDCGHCDDAPDPRYVDAQPERLQHLYRSRGVFRNQAYVERQCESLAQQFVDMFPS